MTIPATVPTSPTPAATDLDVDATDVGADATEMLVRAAQAATAAAHPDAANTEIVRAVCGFTSWEAGYVVTPVEAGTGKELDVGRPVISAWASADTLELRVLRQVTLVGGVRDGGSLVARALSENRWVSSPDVGEAARAAGLAWAAAFPVGRPGDRGRCAFVFLGPDGGLPTEAAARLVSAAVAMAVAVSDRQLRLVAEARTTARQPSPSDSPSAAEPRPASPARAGGVSPRSVRALQSLPHPAGAEVDALRHGIDRGELRLVYQPIVRLLPAASSPPGNGDGDGDDGARVLRHGLVGFEALVRWDHPRRGLVGPLEFVPLAEASGLIGALGRFVLVEACRQAAAWPGGPGAARISVNVSAHQLASPDWADDIEAVLAETGLDPRRLVLEITESAVMADVGLAAERLAAVRVGGVRIALDDFGTGQSSLSYLRTLPVDILKVDKSFIDGLSPDPQESAVARAVIQMAARLGLDAIAEGVSTVAQLAMLRRLRCPYAQGYLFARPLSRDAAADLVSLAATGEPPPLPLRPQ